MFKLKSIYYKIREIVCFIYQKLFREDHTAQSETWDLGYDILKSTLPKLVRFKELTNGTPACLTKEQWTEILDKIIFSFVLEIYIDYNDTTKLEKKLCKELIIDKYGDVREYLLETPKVLLVPHPENSTHFMLNPEGWIEDKKLKETYDILIKSRSRLEGFELFGKYLLNLWW